MKILEAIEMMQRRRIVESVVSGYKYKIDSCGNLMIRTEVGFWVNAEFPIHVAKGEWKLSK